MVDRRYYPWIAAVALFLVVMLCGSVVAPRSPFFGYAYQTIDTGQVGVKIKYGKFIEVVGPGTYTAPFDWNADIIEVNTHAVNFSAEDPEVLTIDKQRIGVTVTGDLFRPGLGQLTEELWSDYRPYFDSRQSGSDAALIAVATEKAKQAMKVCVGERTFEEAAIGERRNDLFVCIDEQLSNYMSAYGVSVRNVVVPNIAISPEMQKQLDDLTKARNQILIEQQNEQLARATGARQLAEQQQAILVEQGRKQEELRQQAINQKLEKELEDAKRQVIEAKIANEIIQANGDLKVSEIDVQVATQKALAELAHDAAWAKIISENPEYAAYQVKLAIAEALAKAGVIIIPAGTDPNLVLGGGVLPTFNVNETPQ